MSTGKRREDRPVFNTANPPTSQSRPSCCICDGTTFLTDQGLKVSMFKKKEEAALFVKTSAADLRDHPDPVAYLMKEVICRRCWTIEGEPTKAIPLSDVLSDLGIPGLRRFTEAPSPRAETPRAPAPPPKPVSPPPANRGKPKSPPPSRIEQFALRYGIKAGPVRPKAAAIVASSGPCGNQRGFDSDQRWTLAEHPALQGLRVYLHDQEEQEREEREAEAQRERREREAEAAMIADGRATVLPDNTVVPRLRHSRPRPFKTYCIRQKGLFFLDGKRCYPNRGIEVAEFGRPPADVPEGVDRIEHELGGESRVDTAKGRAVAAPSVSFDDADRLYCFVVSLRRYSADRDEREGVPHEFEPIEDVVKCLDRKFGFDHLAAAWNAVLDHHAAEPKIVRWPVRRAKEVAAQLSLPPAEEVTTSGDEALPDEASLED